MLKRVLTAIALLGSFSVGASEQIVCELISMQRSIDPATKEFIGEATSPSCVINGQTLNFVEGKTSFKLNLIRSDVPIICDGDYNALIEIRQGNVSVSIRNKDGDVLDLDTKAEGSLSKDNTASAGQIVARETEHRGLIISCGK